MLRRCWLGFKVEFAFLFRHFLSNIELQLASLRYLQFLGLILAAPLALGYLGIPAGCDDIYRFQY